ncbi:MAG: deoxyribodipyrimidine photolyase [Pirellulaceae bacterium]
MEIETTVPQLRIRATNERQLQLDGQWVLYWMTAFRRVQYNFALQYARDVAKQLDRPLVILEALRVRYQWASDRFHRFVIEGMRDNAAACRSLDVLYYPYVEPQPGAGAGLVRRLAEEACLVVTDDYPCFFHPQMIRVVSRSLPARLEAVESNCLMPLAAEERTFTVAHSYRRFMQKTLPQHLEYTPEPNPLDGRSTRSMPVCKRLPNDITQAWPAADLGALLSPGGLSAIPIDHGVGAGAVEGGCRAAEKLLAHFITRRLGSYDHDRNEPDEFGSSELSPHLHFGHISAHDVFDRVMQAEKWHPGKLLKPNGKVNGFWGVGENAEAFLDQLCTWREIGFNMCWRQSNFDRFESLPEWALETLQEHAQDERPQLYSLDEFENAQTHDEIWNAAQRQLVCEGRIHNYMRMLWGKKILHWSRSPREALAIMLELNNKYGLDGRDPNSYSGIFWVLGRYDRAWGPEREIFGKVRYMTSENTAKKHKLKKYLKRYSVES